MEPTILTEETHGEVLKAKIVTMVSLFSISMAVGSLPLLISLKFKWFSGGSDLRSTNKMVMGLLAFGGGVLFATAFMHLLPEVDDNIGVLIESGDLSEWPLHLAPFIMCCGFFAMYLIEELVHVYLLRREDKNKTFTRMLSVRKPCEEVSGTDLPVVNVIKETNNKESKHSHIPISSEDGIISASRGLLVVLALSIHELFEGLAVGLESSASNVWYMFGAVSAHKYIIAFCVGVELLSTGTKRWLSVLYMFIYSFVSALGIGIGILMVGGGSAADEGIYSVVLQGIACGTLVYVVFFEVWDNKNKGMLIFVCSFFGFAIMVVLEVIVEITAF